MPTAQSLHDIIIVIHLLQHYYSLIFVAVTTFYSETSF
jgi:hypothetical protein